MSSASKMWLSRGRGIALLRVPATCMADSSRRLLRLSKTYLGAQFRRLRTRLGAPIAIKAMAAEKPKAAYLAHRRPALPLNVSSCFSRSSNMIFRHELFLIVPKLHQNVAGPKLLICKTLTLRDFAGTPRFASGPPAPRLSPKTLISCAQKSTSSTASRRRSIRQSKIRLATSPFIRRT